jgi:hypothetical protein
LDAQAAAEAQAVAAIAAVTESSTLNNIQIDTTDLTKVSSYGDDYLEYGYWNNGSAPVFSYISGVVTSSDFVDQMIRNDSAATYSGGLSSIVTDPSGAKIISSGTVNLDFNFANQSFAGNVNVTEGNFQADIAGNVHKYGFDAASVTKTANSTGANVTGGNLNGQFYGTNADAAGGRFNLNSSDAGSVSGVFGTTKVTAP